MAYDNLISRTEAAALMPEEASNEIFAAIPENSFVMQMATRLRDMSRSELTLRVEDALPEAYVVGATTAASGDTALLQTSEMNWTEKTVKAAKFGVIIPIAKDVFDDAAYDIWAENKPKIAEAFGKAFDACVIHGTNAPSDWPDDIVTAATAAGHVVDLSDGGTSIGNDLYSQILGVDGMVAFVEESGFFVDGHIAAVSMRAKLRSLRDTTGNPIFKKEGVQPATQYTLDGEPVYFPRNGALNPAAALLISGDWKQLVYSMRKEITFEVLTEATLYDSNGTTITHRLAQEDKIGLKCTMRVGWELPNPPNRVSSSGYPFAIMVP